MLDATINLAEEMRVSNWQMSIINSAGNETLQQVKKTVQELRKVRQECAGQKGTVNQTDMAAKARQSLKACLGQTDKSVANEHSDKSHQRCRASLVLALKMKVNQQREISKLVRLQSMNLVPDFKIYTYRLKFHIKTSNLFKTRLTKSVRCQKKLTDFKSSAGRWLPRLRSTLRLFSGLRNALSR